MKGYKIFNPDLTCRGFQYEIGKDYKLEGSFKVCQNGFHFCLLAQDCFSYYDFKPENVVCEVEALGETQTHDGDSKIATNHIKIIRQLTWDEVLKIANTGKDNTGHSNSGDRNSGNRNSGYSNSGDSNSGYWNSGYWNSGDRNSGYWNSGDRNSGYWNSGNRNSGNRNSGNRNSGNWNSGNWNSGDRNSGDSNSGYRNSGAFCTDQSPILYLFDKPSKMTIKEWENSKAVELMYSIDTTIWIPWNSMTVEEQQKNPKLEASEGYTKTIPIKEAWVNAWGNWSEENRKVFTSLENFDADKFFEITGIRV